MLLRCTKEQTGNIAENVISKGEPHKEMRTKQITNKNLMKTYLIWTERCLLSGAFAANSLFVEVSSQWESFSEAKEMIFSATSYSIADNLFPLSPSLCVAQSYILHWSLCALTKRMFEIIKITEKGEPLLSSSMTLIWHCAHFKKMQENFGIYWHPLNARNKLHQSSNLICSR